MRGLFDQPVVLYQLPRSWGLPNASHFCCKLETYFRLRGISYTLGVAYPIQGPKRKIPYVRTAGGVLYDSRLVIRRIEESLGSYDGWLTPEQRASAHALKRLTEEHLYWVSIYARHCTDRENWRKTKAAVVRGLPPLVRDGAAALHRASVKRNLWGQGLGRLSAAEVFALGARDLEALSGALGDKTYMLGRRPCSLDATVFAFLLNIIVPPIESPLRQRALELENLVSYVERCFDQWYPDLVES